MVLLLETWCVIAHGFASWFSTPTISNGKMFAKDKIARESFHLRVDVGPCTTYVSRGTWLLLGTEATGRSVSCRSIGILWNGHFSHLCRQVPDWYFCRSAFDGQLTMLSIISHHHGRNCVIQRFSDLLWTISSAMVPVDHRKTAFPCGTAHGIWQWQQVGLSFTRLFSPLQWSNHKM